MRYERYYEDSPVYDATIEDIDMDAVKAYMKRIGYGKSPMEYLQENKGFLTYKGDVPQVSTACILLFGKRPQNFFPRARVRFIKYYGTEEKVGREMTVNSVCHRDYSIKGTEIQIKMFDDRLVFETPGKLPGIVRTDNIRHTHFSRNPKIAEYLKAYDYVKEFGEGVDRMCREHSATGTKEPQYHLVAFIMKAYVWANVLKEGQAPIHTDQKRPESDPKTIQKTIQKTTPLQNEILKYLYITPHATINEVANHIKNASLGGIKYNIQRLKTLGLLKRVGSDKGGYWKVLSEDTEE